MLPVAFLLGVLWSIFSCTGAATTTTEALGPATSAGLQTTTTTVSTTTTIVQRTTTISITSDDDLGDLTGGWEFLVDRQGGTKDHREAPQFLPESYYHATDYRPTFHVVISDGGTKISLDGELGGSHYALEGVRTPTSDGRIWYEFDMGRFVIWRTTDGLQAEETAYGSGRPIIHSYRGKLVRKVTDGGASASS
jgi:hypothetical protein